MDLLVRAVDWVVARTVEEDASSVRAPSWEALPGDIFTVLLSYLDPSIEGRALSHLRCVCSTWKQHTDTHLQQLHIESNHENLDWKISEVFPNIQALYVSVPFDAEPRDGRFLEDVSHCQQLKKLVLLNVKGKVMMDMAALKKMKRLNELHVDGDIFKKMKMENVTLHQLKTLVLHRCFGFDKADYDHLPSFHHLIRLVLVDVHPNWRTAGFLSEMVSLEDLAVKQYIAGESIPMFDCLVGLHRLVRLVLSVAGCNIVSLQSLPKMPFLKHLTIEYCTEFSQLCLHSLASNCPNLTSLTIGCYPCAEFLKNGTDAVRLPYLKRIKMENWHWMPVNSLKSLLKDDVQFTNIPSPEMELKLNATSDLSTVQAMLMETRSSDMEQVPISGEYFTPSMMDELTSKSAYGLLKMLVRYGADADCGNPALSSDVDDQRCSTALHFAAHRGDITGVRQLLNLGARPNTQCNDGRTALHMAASTGNVEIVRILLKASANINIVDSDNRTPLHMAVTWRAHAVILELLSHHANQEIIDLDLMSAICYPVRTGDLDLLRFMIRNGMDVNTGSRYNYPTTLHAAVMSGNWGVVQFLLDNGADPTARDTEGRTPLLLAAGLQNLHLMKALLNVDVPYGEILNERDSQGKTVLIYSAMYGWMDIVERLIRMKVDVNRTDLKGFTALYYADAVREYQIVARLTKEGGLARWLTTPRRYGNIRLHRSCRW